MDTFFMNETLFASPAFLIGIVLLSIWSLIWKGLALWQAAKRDHKPWFVLLLVLNTVGIAEIVYLLVLKYQDGQRAR